MLQDTFVERGNLVHGVLHIAPQGRVWRGVKVLRFAMNNLGFDLSNLRLKLMNELARRWVLNLGNQLIKVLNGGVSVGDECCKFGHGSTPFQQ